MVAPVVSAVTSSSSTAVEHSTRRSLFPFFLPSFLGSNAFPSLSLSPLPPKAPLTNYHKGAAITVPPFPPPPLFLSSNNNTKATIAISVCAVPSWLVGLVHFFFSSSAFFPGRRWRVPSQHGFRLKIREEKKCHGKRRSVKEEEEKKKRRVQRRKSVRRERER